MISSTIRERKDNVIQQIIIDLSFQLSNKLTPGTQNFCRYKLQRYTNSNQITAQFIFSSLAGRERKMFPSELVGLFILLCKLNRKVFSQFRTENVCDQTYLGIAHLRAPLQNFNNSQYFRATLFFKLLYLCKYLLGIIIRNFLEFLHEGLWSLNENKKQRD